MFEERQLYSNVFNVLEASMILACSEAVIFGPWPQMTEDAPLTREPPPSGVGARRLRRRSVES